MIIMCAWTFRKPNSIGLKLKWNKSNNKAAMRYSELHNNNGLWKSDKYVFDNNRMLNGSRRFQ